jgi:hypothetical protein
VGQTALDPFSTPETIMPTTYPAAPDIDVITTDVPIPVLGHLAVNSFVIKGSEPILVDTGLAVEKDDYLATLRTVIDPSDIKWIWLTHTDFDHIGGLHALLGENPDLKVITTFRGVGIMSTYIPLPMDRVYLLNPGEKMTIGDRTLHAFVPPTFDNPSTTGFYEEKSQALFSSDCFGAVLDDAVPENASDITKDALRNGHILWTTVDAPWVRDVASKSFAKDLDAVRAMKPKQVLSSHLPAASGDMLDDMLETLAEACKADPFVGPDQPALEQLLQQMGGPPH